MPSVDTFALSLINEFDMIQCAVAHRVEETLKLVETCNSATREVIRSRQITLSPFSFGCENDVNSTLRVITRIQKYSMHGGRDNSSLGLLLRIRRFVHRVRAATDQAKRARCIHLYHFRCLHRSQTRPLLLNCLRCRSHRRPHHRLHRRRRHLCNHYQRCR